MTRSEYTVTTLKNNPGIFYEAIGEMRTSEISWKMIIYVNLDDVVEASKKIQSELGVAIKTCDNLPKICKSHAQLASLIIKLEKIITYQNHIHKLVNNPRAKRAPLEFIGQVSKI